MSDQAQPKLSQEKAGRISGFVYRADTREFLGKASVTLYPQDEATAQAAGGRRVARTGDDGAFEFSDVPPGTYAMEASRNGFVTEYKPDSQPHFILIHSGEEIEDVKFSLVPAGVLSGRVYDEDHEPVAGVRVLALELSFQPGRKRRFNAAGSATTNDQGAFRFSGMRPGSYYLRAGGLIQRTLKEVPLKESPDRRVQYRETWFPDMTVDGESLGLRVEAGTEMGGIEIQVAPQSTWTVSGKIEAAEKNLPRPSQVEYAKDTPLVGMFGPASAPIQSDGSFMIQGLEPGDYLLTASSLTNGVMTHCGYAKVHIADRNVTADIQLGELVDVRGKVVLEHADTSGVKNLRMSLESVNRDELYVSEIDAQGGFDIQNPPPGAYTFRLLAKRGGETRLYPTQIQCSGTDYTASAVNLDVGAMLDGCEVKLADDAGAVAGRISNGDRPQPNLLAIVVPRSRDLRLIPRYTLTARTDSAGHYEIQGVVPGDYYVFALKPDYGHEWFALSFADSHRGKAQSVTINPRQTQRLDLRSP